ncbi:MAG: twin arginine-targeting protein translocase TatB [Xanthobacteraceae bacterium]|jgi:sec-independent protein translocase protein TatB|nr:twin arginine-targeting protein translocase TatB [Xanthobacteraceae bacterium]
MFDIGWSELVVIGVVALIAIGPKELPGVLRMIGQWMGKLRRMASEFQGQFNEAMREAEMDDLKKQVDELNAKASGFGANFDPLGDVTKFDDPFADKPKTATDTPATDMPTSTAPTSAEPVPPAPPADALPTSEAMPLPAPPDADRPATASPAGDKPA